MPAQSRILRATASFNSGSSSEAGRELLVSKKMTKSSCLSYKKELLMERI